MSLDADIAQARCRSVFLVSSKEQDLENLVIAFYGKQIYGLARDTEHSTSCFGGPLELEVEGPTSSEVLLHHLANISHQHIPFYGPPHHVWDVPLLYGFRHDGCVLRYRFEAHEAKVLEISPPTASDSWPYRGFPELLPYVPMKVGFARESTWDQFVEEYAPSLNEQPAELVIIVPPPATIGVSLWGKAGDAEGVSVVFECDLDKREVYAYNIVG